LSYVGNDRFPGLSGGIIPKASIPDKVNRRNIPINSREEDSVKPQTAWQFISILGLSQDYLPDINEERQLKPSSRAWALGIFVN